MEAYLFCEPIRALWVSYPPYGVDVFDEFTVICDRFHNFFICDRLFDIDIYSDTAIGLHWKVLCGLPSNKTAIFAAKIC